MVIFALELILNVPVVRVGSVVAGPGSRKQADMYYCNTVL